MRAILRPAALMIVVLAGVAVLPACGGGTGFSYYQSPDHKAYFKVPSDWTLFTKREMLIGSGQSLSPASEAAFPLLLGFDADPAPAIEHVLSIGEAPRYPVVSAQAQILSSSLRDQMSLQALRNRVYPVDQLVNDDRAEIISYDDNLVLPGGMHGSNIVFDVILGGVSSVVQGNAVIRVNQTGILDPATKTLYMITIRCESHCYRDNKALIDQIARSWTVKER